MERLLNIKEAAEFLNVSAMTVRRWTNQGLLNCYRAGKRRARRFSTQDLMACLEGGVVEVSTGRIAFGFKGFAVPDGSHITHLSSAENESLEVAAAFIREGLQTGEAVCIVADEAKAGMLMSILKQKEIPVEALHAAGKLHVSQGLDSPESQKRFFVTLAAQLGGRLRVFGDMAWARTKGWTFEDLCRLEKAVPNPPQLAGCLFLCQYALSNFEGRDIMMALETHTHSIYRDRIIEGPYGGNLVPRTRLDS